MAKNRFVLSSKGVEEGAEVKFWMPNTALERFLFAIDAHTFNNLQPLT